MQLNILVEGQTEEMFVNEILKPFFVHHGINVTPIIVSTKRLKNGGKFKGGLTNANYGSFQNDLIRLIHSTPHGLVTTFIDYYALPSSFPGHAARVTQTTQLAKVKFLEQELFRTVGSPRNFVPHIQLHEFEALLFSSTDGFMNNIEGGHPGLPVLLGLVAAYANPEDINEGATTAPSKRILAAYPRYDKVIEGVLMADAIGIHVMIARCPHFKEWINSILTFFGKDAIV